MGAWFRGMFEASGIHVDIVEYDTALEERNRLLAQASSVMCAVPIAQAVEVASQLVPRLRSDALLFDITSIKEPIGRAMAAHSGEVVGTHPMCAPTSEGLVSQRVVWCAERLGHRAQALRCWFDDQRAMVVEFSSERHDRLMAVVQALNHFQSIVFAHTLGALGLDVHETMSVASPVYSLRMQLMGRILAQDPALYVDIELQNKYVPEMLSVLQGSASRFHQAIIGGDRERCLEFFTEASETFGSFAKEAKERSDQVLGFVARAVKK
jgi:prephenate dehydrogenase